MNTIKIFSFVFFIFLGLSLNGQNDTLKLRMPEEILLAGKEYSIPFVSTKDNPMVSIQMGLIIDTAKVESISYLSGKLPIDQTNFYFSGNKLNFVWFSATVDPINIPKDTAIFKLHLKMKKSGVLKDMISLNPGFSTEVVFDKGNFNYVIGPVVFVSDTFIFATLIGPSKTIDPTTNIVIVFPNPVKGGSTIRIKNAENYKFYFWVTGEALQYGPTKLTTSEIIIPDILVKGVSYLYLYSKANEPPVTLPVFIE